jgi:hypothetical protein
LSCASGAITCFEVASGSTQTSVPVTFGQPFKAGDWTSNLGLVARESNGTVVPLQADDISSHRDGSVRFAVLSAQLSNVQASQPRIINLFTAAKTASTPNVPADPAWNIEVETRVYSGSTVIATLVAQPQAQLKTQIAQAQGRRLSGSVASEYTVVTPFKDKATSQAHPHLTARFHTRLYEGGNRIRTDVVMENNRTFVANPANITYEMVIKRNGTAIHTQPQFTHNHHARWRKVVWTGGAEPQYRLRHHMPYFLASRSTWNYDLNAKPSETTLAAEASRLASANTAPMGPAFITQYFPQTGGRQDIGPLPRWTALYIVSQDDRARASMLANADAAAGIPIHYRDENTDQPLSVVNYPSVSVLFGNSSPTVPKGSGSTGWDVDTSHQASFAYIPYLVTGDAFYQDEVMFWAAWNIAGINPEYRNREAGLIKSDQVRGQAWSLRSIAESAWALPDNHSMKNYFQVRLANNLNWYAQQYVNNPAESPLGAIQKPDSSAETSPWQNDFMGTVFSLIAENGELKAQETLNWFSKFNVGRFANEPSFCAAHAPGYYWNFRDSSGAYINSWSALYAKNYAGDVGKACSSISPDGYPNESGGYAAYARGMLGAAANAGVSGARDAHTKWKGMTPTMDTAFKADPTWAIAPR